MHKSAMMRIPRPPQAPEPAPAAVSAPAPALGAQDAAATLACRTAIGVETMGADGKAAIVLSLLGIMFAVLARFGADLGAVIHGGGVVRSVCAVLALGFGLSALCAVLQAFRTISPRFRKDKPSLAFFAEIARLERDEYVARVEAMSMQDAVDQILLYNHTAATICAEKFKQLALSLRCFEFASGCWLLLVLILVFKSLHG